MARPHRIFTAVVALALAAGLAAPVTAQDRHDDIVDVARSAGSFGTLLAAAEAAGLVDALQGRGPLTVFAPTDEAFGRLPAGAVDALLLPENRDRLRAILTYHVVAGKVMAADVKTSMVQTVNGKKLDVKVADNGVQIYGGHGYIRETGVEQYVRDMRITLVYEGTTQIQALDLLGRKVLQTQGRGLMHFVGEMQTAAAALREQRPALADTLDTVAAEWGDMTMTLGAKAMENVDEVAAGAVDYLFYSTYAVLVYCWARMAATAAAPVR